MAPLLPSPSLSFPPCHPPFPPLLPSPALPSQFGWYVERVRANASAYGLDGFTLPGTHYGSAPEAFVMQQLLDANYGGWRFFVCGGMHKNDPSWEAGYRLWPLGLSMQVLRPSATIKLDEWTLTLSPNVRPLTLTQVLRRSATIKLDKWAAKSTKLLPTLHWHALPREGSWAQVLADNHYLAAYHQRPFYVLNYAYEANGAAEAIQRQVAAAGANAASRRVDVGAAHAEMARLRREARERFVLAGTLYEYGDSVTLNATRTLPDYYYRNWGVAYSQARARGCAQRHTPTHAEPRSVSSSRSLARPATPSLAADVLATSADALRRGVLYSPSPVLRQLIGLETNEAHLAGAKQRATTAFLKYLAFPNLSKDDRTTVRPAPNPHSELFLFLTSSSSAPPPSPSSPQSPPQSSPDDAGRAWCALTHPAAATHACATEPADEQPADEHTRAVAIAAAAAAAVASGQGQPETEEAHSAKVMERGSAGRPRPAVTADHWLAMVHTACYNARAHESRWGKGGPVSLRPKDRLTLRMTLRKLHRTQIRHLNEQGTKR
jgi:hypothetical protein